MIQIKNNNDLLEKHRLAFKDKIYYEINKLLNNKYYDGIRLSRRILKLLRYIKINYKKFAISKYTEQIELIYHFTNNYPELTKSYKPKQTKPFIYRVIRYLFEIRLYDEFRNEFKYANKTKKYDAYYFVEHINLKTCPYCNRNYISIIQKSDTITKQRRPELDHFHPKSIYPFLSINYFNLIPSCSTCNKLKSDDDSLLLIHPYDTKFNDVTITYWLNDEKLCNLKTEDITLESENSLDIKIEHEDTRYEENKEVFLLEELYKEHKDIVIELILKHIHYPKSAIQELKNFGYGESEIYRFIFSNYAKNEDLSKRPLSKLTKDILIDLDPVAYSYSYLLETKHPDNTLSRK